MTAWSVTVPLASGTNALAVQGRDRNGAPPGAALDTITITNTGPGAPQPVRINEWMADNAGPAGFADPADGLFQDWIELYNPNTAPVDLTGYNEREVLTPSDSSDPAWSPLSLLIR